LQPFLVGLAYLAGFGAAALPARISKITVGILALGTALVCIAFLTNSGFLNQTVAKRTVIYGHVLTDGSLDFWSYDLPPPLSVMGDEYETYQIDEIFRITRVMEDPSVRVFLTFGGMPLNNTSYESKRRLSTKARPAGTAFVGNGYRHGGWGVPGGLHPLFSEASFVLTKSGQVMDGGQDASLYYLFLSATLMQDASPFHAGLERVTDLELPRQETLRVYKRVRAPTLEEWRDIIVQLYLHDSDNPWNAPYIAKMLDYAEETQQRAIGDAAADWILYFAEDPKAGPQLSNRYIAGREFPELRTSFEAACRRAIEWFER